jgi:hypothetical protein
MPLLQVGMRRTHGIGILEPIYALGGMDHNPKDIVADINSRYNAVEHTAAEPICGAKTRREKYP